MSGLARLFATLAVVGTALVAVPEGTGAAAPATGASCADPVDVPLQGPSCKLGNGLWQVQLRDGSVVLTHGHDPSTHFFYTAPTGAPVAPACVADPSREHHNLVIYARPSDRPDRYASLVGEIRQMVGHANAALRAEAALFSRALDYRMACGADGQMAVANVVLSTSLSQTTFSTITSDLGVRGYASPRAKYWIWVDWPFNAGGFGTIDGDDRPGPSNSNNSGPSYAATYGTRLSQGGHNLMMHESGHNLGAVQGTSPHSSGAWHCNDGADLMCYADGGPKSNYSETACPTAMRFDCGHDDYFHPDPPASNYLATHWNLGSPANRYVQGCAYRSGSLSLGAGGLAVDGLSATTVQIPAACAGRRFAVSGIVEAGGVTWEVADVDVCWNAGGVVLHCDTQGAFQTGTVPAGTTDAQVILRTGASASYVLSVV